MAWRGASHRVGPLDVSGPRAVPAIQSQNGTSAAFSPLRPIQYQALQVGDAVVDLAHQRGGFLVIAELRADSLIEASSLSR